MITFTRYPQAGKTKTRLIPVLGALGAAELQRRMAERMIAEAQELVVRRVARLQICYDGGSHECMRRWLGPRFDCIPQTRGDLGRRMGSALGQAFDNGCPAALLAGSDVPELTGKILEIALDRLHTHDLVLGPARDGGYYLIGMTAAVSRRALPAVFDDIPWSTGEVLSKTLAIATALDLNTSLLPTLSDVDHPSDLEVWDRTPRIRQPLYHPEKISVVIPALNEAVAIAATIQSATGEPDSEIIVVDGGSRDTTREQVRSMGIPVIESAPSRAAQMNAGAALARGGTLLFLHADTTLPPGYGRPVRNILQQPGVVGGAFRLHIEAPGSRFRWVERMVDFRSRRLQLPYGDQGLFVKAAWFHQLGGFPLLPIMEDFVFVRRLAGWGNIAQATAAVTTSPRRWLRKGIVKTTLTNQAVITAYHLGISPTRLARWYYGPGHPGR